jgi:predicted ATPase
MNNVECKIMDYIEIEGYKSIKKAKIELRPINILIGANGSGKSNFLSFFEFLKRAYDQELQAYVAGRSVDKFLFNGRKITDAIRGNIKFSKYKEHTNNYDFTISLNDKNFIITSEKLDYNGWGVNIANNCNELKVKNDTSYRAKFIQKYLNNLKKFHFHDVGELSPFNNDVNVIDNRTLQSKGGNLAAVLYRLKNDEPITYNLIVKTIQSIAPYFKDFDLEPNNNLISLAWRDKFSENLYSAVNLSDGTLRFIALTTLFLQPNLPQTIIIDEPELGLHPFAIAKLAGLIKSAASKDCQVIVATQSVELLNHFQPNDIIAVDNVNGESRFNRLNSDELAIWLEDYSLGDLWKMNIIETGNINY